MNFLKAGMHKLPEYMQLRQAVKSNALPATKFVKEGGKYE